MKLSDYATRIGVSYKTVYNYYTKGILNAYQLDTGTIIVDDNQPTKNSPQDIRRSQNRVVLYARVSSSENIDNLEAQLIRLRNFANLSGYKIVKEIKEIGSGVNDKRKKLLSLLSSDLEYNILLVEHKDRFSRFGTSLIEALLNKLQIQLEIINEPEDEKADIIQDLISIITSYSAKIYGLRRHNRRTLQIIDDMQKKFTTCQRKRDCKIRSYIRKKAKSGKTGKVDTSD